MDEQYKITVDAQRAPVIEPGYTFGSVTETDAYLTDMTKIGRYQRDVY